MSEMVERAARAAYEAEMEIFQGNGYFVLGWDSLPPFAKEAKIKAQYAAIEAMRELPHEVIDNAFNYVGFDAQSLTREKQEIADDWRTVIDAILSKADRSAPAAHSAGSTDC